MAQRFIHNIHVGAGPSVAVAREIFLGLGKMSTKRQGKSTLLNY